MNYLNDSGEFHDVESNLVENVHTFPINQQGSQVRDPCCDTCLQPETWNPSGLQEKLFCKSSFDVWVATSALSRNASICDTKCYRWGSGAHWQRGTCCKRERTNWKHNPNADICTQAVNHEILQFCGYSTEFCGWTAKTADIGTSIWQIHYSIIIFRLEDKIQRPGDYLFWFSFGSSVMDQRGGDGRFNGGTEVITIMFKCWTRRLPLLWTRSSKTPR